jgi:transcriptional regulator with XRE-family HTH domain
MAPGFTPRKLLFAESLKAARKRADMSQERAAAAVGTSRRHWIRWESGETSPNPAYLDRIATVLGAPELLEAAEDEEAASMQPLGRETELLAALAVALDPFHPRNRSAFDQQAVEA